jgi:hypothetical protein
VTRLYNPAIKDQNLLKENKGLKLFVFALQNVSDEILNSDIEIFGDLMLDVAEAYMGQQEYQEALTFLEKLVQSENWSKVSYLLL